MRTRSFPRPLSILAVTSALATAGCNHQFATYTGVPRTPEFKHRVLDSAPDGFRVAQCRPPQCRSPSWRGYRDLDVAAGASEQAFVTLARNFGAAFLEEDAASVDVALVAPFRHEAKEVGTRSLLGGGRTELVRSTLSAEVRSRTSRARAFVSLAYSTINGRGKIYAATGETQVEAEQNLSFRHTADL